jgi:hypothetical protein
VTVIRTYTTFAGARREAPAGPIVRLLADPEDLFVTGLRGGSSIMAVDPKDGSADGTIKVLDLMAGGAVAGCDLRQGVTIGGHEVLDLVDERRGEEIEIMSEAALAENNLRGVRGGDLQSRRTAAIATAARLILIVDEIDRELAR